MRPSQILQLVALVFGAIAVIAAIKAGKLKGRQRLFVIGALSCFALSWIANTYGW